MDDLLAWLTACLDEIERVAREATDGPWRWRREDRLRLETAAGQWEYDAFDATHDWWPDATVIESSGLEEHDLVIETADAVHIARNDPRSVLARIEAERMLLVAREHLPLAQAVMSAGSLPALAVDDIMGATTSTLDMALRMVAYGHRYDCPGWQDSWAPEGVEVAP